MPLRDFFASDPNDALVGKIASGLYVGERVLELSNVARIVVPHKCSEHFPGQSGHDLSL